MFRPDGYGTNLEAMEVTKLAATKGATVEETIATAQAVPAIEGVDINDGWIIDRTQQIDTGNGLMKYVIQLPGDPTPFECTPFQIDMRRDMIKMWMGAVRQAMVERAGAALAATREAALAAQRAKLMEGPGIEITDQLPTPAEAAALSAAVKRPPVDPDIARKQFEADERKSKESDHYTSEATSSDPVEYAKQQLEKAEAEHEHWTLLQTKAARNAKTAGKAVLKWKTVLESISEDQEEGAGGAVHMASGSRAEKAAHKPRT
jgi:hypothetical protein